MNHYIKKYRFYIALCTITVATVVMSYVTAGAQSDNGNVEREVLNCFFQGRGSDELISSEKERLDEIMQSEYAQMWDESIGSVTEAYHEKMNEKFNEYIEKSKAAGEVASHDPNSQEAINGRAPDTDSSEEVLQKCAENDYANYSTYCAAVTLYADPSFGYKGFRDVMSCRKFDVFESTQERESYGQGEYSIDQAQKALSINNKVSEANRALADAKAALDQTLSAYDQMKLAWSMHTRYVKIYEDLLKYRDKLVDMRHYVDSFPSKFIDASTTQCT